MVLCELLCLKKSHKQPGPAIPMCMYSIGARPESIMLWKLLIMLFGIAPIFAYYARFYATPQSIMLVSLI